MQHIHTVADLVDYASEKYKNKDFCSYISDGEIKTVSYERFRHDAVSVSRYIRSVTKSNIHIAFIGKTGYEYIACLTGMILSGNTVVPFAPDISVSEACVLFEDADISYLFCEDEFTDKARQIKDSYPALKKIISLGDTDFFNGIFEEYSKDEYSYLSDFTVDADALSLIVYTSGTTGTKKGVMLTNRNLAANSTYDTYTMEGEDISFSILPMHHIFCYSCDVLKTLYDGGKLCLNGDLADIFVNFRKFNPTVMRIVPAICRSILTRIKLAERRNPELTPREAAETVVGKNLRRMIAGSAFLSGYLIDELEKYGITARQGYGMSECSPRITTADFSDNHKYSNGILTGVDQVRVLDGEIQVKGPSVMAGYYKRPDATALSFTEDGFLHTGDLGYLEDGHIYLVGRKKNLIILSNGENISPEEIENRFADEAQIKEIVVFGQNDKICAEIYPEENVDEAAVGEIIRKINIASPSDRQIESFVIRSTPFERTSTGKIKRKDFHYSQEVHQ